MIDRGDMKLIFKKLFCVINVLVLSVIVSSATLASPLSPNIPLDSYIYTYLDKLEGLGYLEELQPGIKPYSRMQVAGWIQRFQEKAMITEESPEYVRAIMERLLEEFSEELAALDGASLPNGIAFKEISWANGHYEGEPIKQHPGLPYTDYHPLDVYQNGYELHDGFNSSFTAQVDARLHDNLILSLTPHLQFDEDNELSFSWESGYLKTRFRNTQIQWGKDAFWWGRGKRGSLALTNNATPFTSIVFRNVEPVRFERWLSFLNKMDYIVLYADMERNRSDVRSPGFFGWRTDFTPRANFSFGMALTSMVGGEGHELSLSDLWDFITGENAWTTEEDKWNMIAGWDWRLRIPRLRGLQFYGEHYGEDQHDKIPSPLGMAHVVGLYIPRLTKDGSWDLRFETAHTSDIWYVHTLLYKNGYTYKNKLIADAMGTDSNRFYVRLGRYLADGSLLAFHGEHLELNDAAVYPQTVDSFWVSYLRKLDHTLTVNFTIGVACLDNLDEMKGNSDTDYLVKLQLTKSLK